MILRGLMRLKILSRKQKKCPYNSRKYGSSGLAIKISKTAMWIMEVISTCYARLRMTLRFRRKINNI